MVGQSEEAVPCSCFKETASELLATSSGIKLGQVEIDELDIVHCQYQLALGEFRESAVDIQGSLVGSAGV